MSEPRPDPDPDRRPELVLGPLLRHVDATSATIWVETSAAATVTVTVGEQRGSARTFRAHDHHYALVDVVGLEPGSRTAYTVDLDGDVVWPSLDPELRHFPVSVVATMLPGRPLRMAFGSCRVSVPHDADHNATFGVDALRAYALSMAGLTGPGDRVDERWPDLVLFLGDQVYADETSDAMRSFIARRRDPAREPGWELQDFEEYAHLYRISWSDPANRWLLSTLPSAMIFDDHDIRDDWNTSWSWRQRMEATTWWHDRVVGGLASYWVYQHLGNLRPERRAEDELWSVVAAHDGPEELDLTEPLDTLAARADQKPDSYRWSFVREFDTQARLVVVDSRAARVLEPERRSMLDDLELEWLDEQLRGDVDHLVIGTSLPFLLAPGLHHAESWDEAVSEGAWGRLAARAGEWARQAADMEHWAAFQDAFQDVAAMVLEVARGVRGRAPRTITFLSGDVHHSYVAEARPRDGVVASRIVQAVCSPIRNPLPTVMKQLTATAARRPIGAAARVLSRAAGVAPSPLTWSVTQGPWYDNNLAVLELGPQGLEMRWLAGESDGDPGHPALRRVATVDPLG